MLRLANAIDCDFILRLKDTKCRSGCRKSLQLRLAIAKSLAIVIAWFRQSMKFVLRSKYKEGFTSIGVNQVAQLVSQASATHNSDNFRNG